MAEFETFTLRTLGCFKMIAHLCSPFWIREGASRTNIFRNQNHRFRSKFTYCKLFEAYAGVIFLGKIDSALIQEVQKQTNRIIACNNPVAVSSVGTLVRMVLTEEGFNWLQSLSLEELFTILLWIPVVIRARVFDRELDYQTLRQTLRPIYYTRRVRPRRESFAEHEQEQEQEQEQL